MTLCPMCQIKESHYVRCAYIEGDCSNRVHHICHDCFNSLFALKAKIYTYCSEKCRIADIDTLDSEPQRLGSSLRVVHLLQEDVNYLEIMEVIYGSSLPLV